MAQRFTEEQIKMAMETSLTSLASSYGFTPVRVGKLYTLKEHDSVRIYDDRSWCRWSRMGSRGENGGSQIDFLMNFCGIESFSEAVEILLKFQGMDVPDKERHAQLVSCHQVQEKGGEREFILPAPVEGNYRRLYAYLLKTRGLSKDVIDYFVRDLKILYEEHEHHNMVFLGKDREGTVRYATKRGTMDIYGKKYRGDVAGSDKNYGVNIITQSQELKVFEASIDLMSYLDITGDYESNKLVLSMVADNPLVQFLKDHPQIRSIGFCLDNDKAGKAAVYGGEENREGLLKKYASQGYVTYADMVPEGTGCKDWNEYLVYLKTHPDMEKSLQNVKGRSRKGSGR